MAKYDILKDNKQIKLYYIQKLSTWHLHMYIQIKTPTFSIAAQISVDMKVTDIYAKQFGN